MDSTTWKRVPTKRAAEVCRDIPAFDQGLKWLRGEHTPEGFLAALRENRRYHEALQFLAFALPMREAVWWTCVCVETAPSGATSTVNERAALDAAVQWVVDPTEAKRLAIYGPGHAPGVEKTVAGSVAAAAYYTGKNRLAPSSPVAVPPSPALFNQTVYQALLLAASGGEGFDFIKRYRQFIALGQEIAAGKYLWTSAV